MIRPNAAMDSSESALKNFHNIQESIKGLFEIISINLSEKDIYFKLAADNIEALYQNFLDLIMNENGAHLIKKKLKNAELEADIPLGKLSISGDKKVNF
jgi:hypothetical protein